jgi:hypothetical protein
MPVFTPSSLPSLFAPPSLHRTLTAFLHAPLSHTFHFFWHAIILLSFITSMHDIYNYIPVTNHVYWVYNVAAILWLFVLNNHCHRLTTQLQ